MNVVKPLLVAVLLGGMADSIAANETQFQPKILQQQASASNPSLRLSTKVSQKNPQKSVMENAEKYMQYGIGMGTAICAEIGASICIEKMCKKLKLSPGYHQIFSMFVAPFITESPLVALNIFDRVMIKESDMLARRARWRLKGKCDSWKITSPVRLCLIIQQKLAKK